jgi:uncharacterized protein (DUF58 family)
VLGDPVQGAAAADPAHGKPAAPVPESVCCSLAALAALRALAPALRGRRPRRVREARAAHVHSPFRGRGMEYAESRPYSPGDDARHVDWRVSARSGQLHSKLFHAERERVSAVVYDAAPWMAFGSRGCFKSVQAARLAALFVWDAIAQGDRVAAVCNRAERRPIAPAGGERGALQLLAQLCRWQPQVSSTEPTQPVPLAQALGQIERLLRPGSRLLLTVDAHALDAPAMRRLQHLHRHHDLLVALLVDPLERAAPRAGCYPVSDGERTLWLSAAGASERRRWEEQLAAAWRERLDALHRQAISARLVSTVDAPLEALRELLSGALSADTPA